jgi:hypothetical protein
MKQSAVGESLAFQLLEQGQFFPGRACVVAIADSEKAPVDHA